MLTTATAASVVLLLLGGLLTRLLHFSPGALAVASGIILIIIAVTMVLGHNDGSGGSQLVLSGLSDVGVIHLTSH
jgi:small neutral amino acid transporter SnatA (MarC family)